MWTRLLTFASRLGFVWARRRLDDEARHEFDLHLDLLVNKYIHAGMTSEEAHIAAQRQLGNVTLAREKIYQMNSILWLEGLFQDLRYALRQLRSGPVFATVVVGTLALGIGGTTSVFSVVQAVLLTPLAYEQPGELVRFYQQEPDKPETRYYLAGTHFRSLREYSASFEEVAALDTYSETGLDLVGRGEAQRLRVLRVTSGYFRTLSSGALRGPGFDIRDEDGTRRVVLSDALWRTRFDSDASVIGATIHLSAEPYQVVGIAAPGFEDPVVGEVDAWLPLDLVGNTSEQNDSLTAVGRLRNGVNLEQARAELAALSQSMRVHRKYIAPVHASVLGIGTASACGWGFHPHQAAVAQDRSGQSSTLQRVTRRCGSMRHVRKFWLWRGPFRPARGPTGCPRRGAATL